MATYAIGDIQGCFSALQKVIDRIRFDPAKDRLWLVGDLVNRGPDSLKVLRYAKSLGPAAVSVLGNHDLHLLAVAAGCTPGRTKDTFQDVLNAPDRDELLHWLRHRPLLFRDHDFLLVHAGLLPQWTSTMAVELAREVECTLQSDTYQEFLRIHYKNGHTQWRDELTGLPRLSVIANALTRLRICTPCGDMEFSYTGPPEHAPTGFLPWFEIPHRKSADVMIVCGHWAAAGLRVLDNVLTLDSGCIWGRHLTAVRLEDRQVVQVSCDDRGCRGA
jgi:bis(5'-nucleosyl)-tetraphosphatase (symmetrical)